MKKIIALAICLVSTVAILCSCEPKGIINSGSNAAKNESSIVASKETEVTSNKTESVKEDKSSSKKEEISSEDESSSRIPSKNNRTSSVSTSSSVKVPVNSNTVEIGCF